jgi:hypothetical protein
MRKKDRPRALGSRLALRDMRLRAGLTPGQLAERLGDGQAFRPTTKIKSG